jgi:hypothetical protein
MAKPSSNQTDLRALRNLISEAHLILETTELPQGRAKRAHELLGAAVKLADDLLTTPPAAALGQRGGTRTREKMTAKDPDYFRKIAGMRKKRAGGRPRKREE